MDLLSTEKIRAEVEEFEDFVADYTTQLEKILKGQFDEEQRKSARAEIDAQLAPAAESATATTIRNALKAPSVKSKLQSQKEKSGVVDYSRWEHFKEDDEDNQATSDILAEVKDAENSKAADIVSSPSKGNKWREDQIERVQKHSEASRREGNDLFKTKKYPEAIEAYSKSVRALLEPESITASEKKNDPFDFLEKYRQPIGKLPVNPMIYTNRALCYINLNMWNEAEADCTAALELDPTNVKGLWRRVIAREKLHKLDKLAECLSDLNVLQDIVEEYEKAKKAGNKNVIAPAVTLKEVTTLRCGIEKDLNAATKLDKVARKLEGDGIVAVLKGILASIDEKKLTTQGAAQSAFSAALKYLCQLISGPDAQKAKDAMQVSGLLEKCSSASVLNPTTIQHVVPMLLASCQGHAENSRLVGKEIVNIVKSLVLGLPLPNTATLVSTLNLLAILTTDETCLSSFVKLDLDLGCKFAATVLLSLRDETDKTVQAGKTYGLSLLDAAFNQQPRGASTLVHKWGLTPNLVVPAIVVCIKTHLEPSCKLINTIIGLTGLASRVLVVDHHADALLDVLLAELKPKSKDVIKTQLVLVTAHNILIHTSHSITPILIKYSTVSTVIPYFKHPDLFAPTMSILSRLLKQNSNHVLSQIDGWWDELPILSILNDKVNHKELRGPALRILIEWIRLQKSRVAEWKKTGGFECLANIIKSEMETTDTPRDEFVVGNAALCVGDCTLTSSHAETFLKMGVVEDLIKLLRIMKDVSAQRNVAVSCAKLCQVDETGKVLDCVRSLSGIELLHSLSNKITV
ncbi:hypothetical protein SmJEL517_g04292 [Synchytrium microbalum]|uniref:Uncharacterized protein n=1 Tax=Synchytrium microbalum TaxID=1806994 RepID=A0A507BZS5_9FUNG|nr:uncharacterized protein SmJEL517_g04292 [Synchytrium microbalum]TPX32618.1 hypothetical protein SmJEL517_g04292 [Synchytrium microbalum]